MCTFKPAQEYVIVIIFDTKLGDGSLQGEYNYHCNEDDDDRYDCDPAVAFDKANPLISMSALSIEGSIIHDLLIVLCVHIVEQSKQQ